MTFYAFVASFLQLSMYFHIYCLCLLPGIKLRIIFDKLKTESYHKEEKTISWKDYSLIFLNYSSFIFIHFYIHTDSRIRQ